MFKKPIFYLILILVGLVLVIFLLLNVSGKDQRIVFLISSEKTLTTIPNKLQLAVPYTSETPEGIKTKPWVNACEEASVTMVEKYYLGQPEPVIIAVDAKNFMDSLFTAQNKKYGSNANASLERTLYLIKNHTSFDAQIVESPKLEEIKKELRAGRPVITPHYGFALKNDNIPFAPTGSSYHMTVIVGYDDLARQFIVNDPGDDQTGQAYRYDYDLFLNSLHDYNHQTDRADGPARVLFTFNQTEAENLSLLFDPKKHRLE